jgi:hypothetical protein
LTGFVATDPEAEALESVVAEAGSVDGAGEVDVDCIAIDGADIAEIPPRAAHTAIWYMLWIDMEFSRGIKWSYLACCSRPCGRIQTAAVVLMAW